MALIDEEIVENSGLIKEIDMDDMDIIMNTLQKDIYTDPVRSSMREYTSNTIDAVAEKLMALAILSGKASIEDYFVTDTRKIAKASKFDIDYYDAKYLNDEEKVFIKYIDGVNGEKDQVSFADFGVGLGGKRLEGFFKPGYSSKRLSKKMLGKFGLGNKSALATSAKFYVLETWYNGYYSKFMIYDEFYKCIIPQNEAAKTTYIQGKKYDKDDDDKEIIVDTTENVYWQKTERANGVTITFEALSTIRQRYIDAVTQQFMYFDEKLDFQIVTGDSSFTPDFRAKILYKADLFIISENSYLTEPHILVNNVNYGLIDWAGLGMNKIHGSAAIRAGSNDVSMSAQREAIKFDEKTRGFIQKGTKSASEEAGKLLQAELVDIKDPIKRYLAAGRYSVSDSDEHGKLLKQLKSFGSGDIDLKVEIDAKDYLSPMELKALNLGITSTKIAVGSFISIFYEFKSYLITTKAASASIDELRTIRDLDLDNLYYMKHEDNLHNIRLDTVLYITKDRHNKSFQFINYKTWEPKAMSIEEMIEGLKNPEHKNMSPTSKMAIRLYRDYQKSLKIKKLHWHVFEAMLQQSGKSINSIDQEEVKAFAKTAGHMDNPVLRQTLADKENGRNGVAQVFVKSAKEKQKEDLALLKKEKKVLNYRLLRLTTRVTEKWEPMRTHADFTMETVKTETLLDIPGTVVYAATEDRFLLKFGNLIYMLATGNKARKHSLPIADDQITFIQIAKENFKFFSTIPGSMDIQTFIKQEHKENEDGTITIEFGEATKQFLTGAFIHQLVSLSPINRVILKPEFLEFVAENFDNFSLDTLSEASKILKKFPFTSTTEEYLAEGESTMDILKRDLGTALVQGPEVISDILDGMLALTRIQNTPKEYLEKGELAMVQSFKGVNVKVYNSVLVKAVDSDLLKYRSLLELMYVSYVISTETYDPIKTQLLKAMNVEIEEKIELITS